MSKLENKTSEAEQANRMLDKIMLNSYYLPNISDYPFVSEHMKSIVKELKIK